MNDDLLTLRNRVPTPLVGHADGMAVAVDPDGRVTTFSSEAAARFYVAAHREVPALYARITELERTMNPAMAEKMVRDIASLMTQLDARQARIAELERLLTLEVDKRTKAQAQAKLGRLVAARLAETAKRCEALQHELDEVRKP